MNKYAPHVYVIPEDDRDRQIADGFVLHHQVKDTRIQVVPAAREWRHVLEAFRDEYIPNLRNFPDAHVVMLIDFDGQVETRKTVFESEIPADLKTRVFVIGPRHTPEILTSDLQKNFEEIGTSLAADCDAGTTAIWDHAELNHNDADRRRLAEIVKPFLF